MISPRRITVEDLGPIKRASIQFGDLTVLVGPQATGKSLFLQLLKLAVDRGFVYRELKRFNLSWNGDHKAFLDLFFGDGMRSLATDGTSIRVDGKDRSLSELSRPAQGRQRGERLFYIPAQRVMSFRDGLTRPFTDYRAGDPFVLREFSENLHTLVQTEFGTDPDLFPKTNRLKASLRKLVQDHIFGGFALRIDTEKFQKRIVLTGADPQTSLPYLVWSAGQREFTPLLMGLYWLLPPSKVSRRAELEWVVIEELEMGLHPYAISTTLALVLELMWRGYRVCLSTHSPHVLDVVWGLQFLKHHGGTPKDVLDIFGLHRDEPMKNLAERALKSDYRTYFFTRSGTVQDISGLDPAAENEEEAGWGGLSGFSGHVGEILSRVANRKTAS